jgi:phage terminase large subunit-like protein
MADDLEAGPDPNDVRRHAKKLYTELQYRQKYRRIDFYRPNFKQEEFHNLVASERMLRAGNQLGKTQAAAAQMTFDALALYPDWYTGRKFLVPPKIERPFDFIGWAGCTTSGKTRDGAQIKLLGDIRQQGGLGTGLIPLDNIVGKPTMARGIADFADTVSLRRETGGNAVIRFKTFEMGREAWQGEPVDVIWGDEDPGDFEVYGECQARLTTTRGIIIWSMTPMLGLSPVRRHFKEGKPGTAEILMTIEDAAVSRRGHIPDEDIAEIVARYGEDASTRAFGADMQGEGAVFLTKPETIKERRDPAELPVYWPWLWALDFSHAGLSPSGHPFAAVLGCWDRDNDVIHVVHAVRIRQALAPTHVAMIKQHPCWEAPVAWPHDGGRGGSLVSGETIAAIYKKLGLAMREEHATFKDGGYNFEAGILQMQERFARGGLKVAAHLSEWLDEYQGYHRDGGLVVKIDDDLLSATRVLCMDIRHAKVPAEWRGFRERRAVPGGEMAEGVDFDLFTGA